MRIEYADRIYGYKKKVHRKGEQKKENTLRYAQFVSNLLEDTGLVCSVAVCILLMSRQKIQMADLAFIFALAPFIFRFFNCFTNTWNYLTDVYTDIVKIS